MQQEWQKQQQEQWKRLQQEKRALSLQSKTIAKLPTRKERSEVIWLLKEVQAVSYTVS